MKNYLLYLGGATVAAYLLAISATPAPKHYSVIDLNFGVYESQVFTNKAAAQAKLIEFQNSLDTRFHRYTIVEVK